MLRIYKKALVSGTVDVLTYNQAMAALLEQKVKLLDIKSEIAQLVVALESLTGTHLCLTQGPPGGKGRGKKRPGRNRMIRSSRSVKELKG